MSDPWWTESCGYLQASLEMSHLKTAILVTLNLVEVMPSRCQQDFLIGRRAQDILGMLWTVTESAWSRTQVQLLGTR